MTIEAQTPYTVRVPVAVISDPSPGYRFGVVCDDGTVWQYRGHDGWAPLKGSPIPGTMAYAQKESIQQNVLLETVRLWNTARLAALACPEERAYEDRLVNLEERLADLARPRTPLKRIDR